MNVDAGFLSPHQIDSAEDRYGMTQRGVINNEMLTKFDFGGN